jgi:hypothetical protein
MNESHVIDKTDDDLYHQSDYESIDFDERKGKSLNILQLTPD